MCRRSTASRPATPTRPATCSSARRAANGDHAHQRRARRARARRRATATRSALLKLRPHALPRVTAGQEGPDASATRAARAPRRRAGRPRRRRDRQAHGRAAGDKLVVTVSGAPDDDRRAAAARARASARSPSPSAARSSRACRWSTADAVAAATFFDRLRDWLGNPVTLILLGGLRRSVASTSCCFGGARCAAGRGDAPAEGHPPHDHHRHAQRGDRQVAVGAELPARAPPPHRRAAHDAGRQGRQRRPRAQDARPAGDRHRASRAGRPARGSSTS